jgi:hypothetical protein
LSLEIMKITIAALLAALGTYSIQLLLRNWDNGKKSKQVKSLLWESCRRVSVYLNAMLKEDNDESMKNLRARIDGIEVILKLLSEMQMHTIPFRDTYPMFRTRELIHEILSDLKLFLDNYQKTRQFEVDVKALIVSNELNKEEKAHHLNSIKEYKDDLIIQYENLCKDIKRYIENLNLVRTDYKKLHKEIYKLNKNEIMIQKKF